MTGGLKLRDRERARFFFFVAVNCLMNVGLTIGQSVSEGLFLSRADLGPGKLPLVFIFTAVATALTTFVYAAFVDKWRNDRYFQIIHVYAIVALILILIGINADATPAFMAFYGFFYVAQGIFNTHFWNYATDYFDAVEAKRLFPYFPLGNSIGGFLGGTLTSVVGESVEPIYLAGGWLVLLVGTALLIQLVSPRLKGWVVMEAEESDEASLDNVRQGFNFLRRSPMGRWHITYALVMIISLFFLQYLYSNVFAQAYPDAEQLTAFIGRFLAITNIVEVVLELTFTPRLIGLAGVGAANMFYPLSTLTGFVLIGGFYNVPSAVFSRMNRETFENAISASCRNLLYNAYPTRFRGRIRAFIEGAVTNAGIVVAGLAMLVLARIFDADRLTTVVVWLGGGMSVIFFAVAFVIRHQYLASLVRGLKDYRLDLEDVTLELDKVKDDDLHEMLPVLEAQEDEASMALVMRIFRVLLGRGALEPLLEGIGHPNRKVQLAALQVLGHHVGVQRTRLRVNEGFDERLRTALRSAVENRETPPEVRARSIEVLAEIESLTHVAPFLDDDEPQVRAAAASVLVQNEGMVDARAAWARLEAMLTSEQPQVRTAALRRLPMQLPRCTEMLLDHVRDEDPQVRVALLDQLAAMQHAENPLPQGIALRVQPMLTDSNDEVRAGIVRFLGGCEDETVVPLLSLRLDDDSIHVRRAAIEALRPWGAAVVPYVRPLLGGRSTTAVDAALSVLGGVEDVEGRDLVRDWLQTQIELAHDATIAQHVMASAMTTITRRLDERDAFAVEHAFSTTEPLASIAISDFVGRVIHHTLNGLESLEDPTVIRNIRRCLEMQNRQARGDAMEALSNLSERSIAQGLLLLLDDSSLKERAMASLSYRGLEKPEPWGTLQDRLQHHPDRWIRVASAILAEETEPGSGGSDYQQTEEYAVMKNLLFLKKVPLFAQMSLEQLEIISRIVNELSFFKGEVIFKEAEMGDKLYIIVAGKVSVVKNYRTPHEVSLALLKETDYFGEMSVLDNEPRSATIVVEEDSRLLSISGEKLRDIIHQKPEIAFEIFKVLSGRLRRADSKLSELARENLGLKQKAEAEPALSG